MEMNDSGLFGPVGYVHSTANNFNVQSAYSYVHEEWELAQTKLNDIIKRNASVKRKAEILFGKTGISGLNYVLQNNNMEILHQLEQSIKLIKEFINKDKRINQQTSESFKGGVITYNIKKSGATYTYTNKGDKDTFIGQGDSLGYAGAINTLQNILGYVESFDKYFNNNLVGLLGKEPDKRYENAKNHFKELKNIINNYKSVFDKKNLKYDRDENGIYTVTIKNLDLFENAIKDLQKEIKGHAKERGFLKEFETVEVLLEGIASSKLFKDPNFQVKTKKNVAILELNPEKPSDWGGYKTIYLHVELPMNDSKTDVKFTFTTDEEGINKIKYKDKMALGARIQTKFTVKSSIYGVQIKDLENSKFKIGYKSYKDTMSLTDNQATMLANYYTLGFYPIEGAIEKSDEDLALNEKAKEKHPDARLAFNYSRKEYSSKEMQRNYYWLLLSYIIINTMEKYGTGTSDPMPTLADINGKWMYYADFVQYYWSRILNWKTKSIEEAKKILNFYLENEDALTADHTVANSLLYQDKLDFRIKNRPQNLMAEEEDEGFMWKYTSKDPTHQMQSVIDYIKTKSLSNALLAYPTQWK